MARRNKFMFREAGTALAVLAIYVLTLLAPMHQANGLQRDFAALGYETIGAWSICGRASPQDHNGDRAPTIAKCPVAGIAKHTFLAPAPPAATFAPSASGARIDWPVQNLAPASTASNLVAQPRAPPAST